MALDIGDTISSSLSKVLSKAGAAVVTLTLALILVMIMGVIGASIASMVHIALAGLAVILTFCIYVALSMSLTVGSFRAFNEEDVSKEMFTENIVWPFLRMMGANIVLQAFIFTAIYVLVYPAIMLGAAFQTTLSSNFATSPELISETGTMTLTVLGVSGIILVAVMLYVMAKLAIALPRISVSDKRLFQALDESVQTTRGNELAIIATFLPFALIITAAIASIIALGSISGFIAYIVLLVIGGLYWLSLLTELNSRL